MAPLPPAPDRPRLRLALVLLLLGLHAALCVSSLVRKSHTSDEVLFITGGLGHWLLDDYRMGPEGGLLPQRWATLPLLFMDVRFPSSSAAFADGDVWAVGHELLYDPANDLFGILIAARSMIVAVSVLLGVLVWHVSSRLFGAAGGLVSLTLYGFCPSVLAHAGLVTADLMASATFFAAVMTLWWLLARITPLRLLASTLSVAALLLTKMSALLILPLAAILALVRLLDGRPLPVRLGRWRFDVAGRGGQVAVLAGAALVHLVVAAGLIWTCFGFRFAASPVGGAPSARLERQLETMRVRGGQDVQAIGWIADRHGLPQAYLFGLAYQLETTQVRRAFAAGRYSLTGWSWFFPYAVAIKTPLATFGVMLLALAAGVHRLGRLDRARRIAALRRGFYRTLPLWSFLGIYWVFAIGSKLNIGHRHVLPAYVPAFVLAGAAGYWLRRGGVLRWATGALLFVLFLTALRTWPDYLAFFNRLGGGPENGYRHLVDSSLDWGQDLPALADWIEDERSRGRLAEPVYLAYFGNAVPARYGVDAVLLPGVPDLRPPAAPIELHGGTYAISATLLQSTLQLPMGPWCDVYENLYREDKEVLDRFRAADADGRRRIEAEGGGIPWRERTTRFEELRLGRLCAWLRQRRPDASAGHSILVYRVTEAEVRAALDGPPAELAHGIQVEAP